MVGAVRRKMEREGTEEVSIAAPGRVSEGRFFLRGY